MIISIYFTLKFWRHIVDFATTSNKDPAFLSKEIYKKNINFRLIYIGGKPQILSVAYFFLYKIQNL